MEAPATVVRVGMGVEFGYFSSFAVLLVAHF